MLGKSKELFWETNAKKPIRQGVISAWTGYQPYIYLMVPIDIDRTLADVSVNYLFKPLPCTSDNIGEILNLSSKFGILKPTDNIGKLSK